MVNTKIYIMSSARFLGKEECRFKYGGYFLLRSRKPKLTTVGDSLRWPRDTPSPLKLALTSPTSGGRSVGIVRLRTISPRSLFGYFWQNNGWTVGYLIAARLSCAAFELMTNFEDNETLLCPVNTANNPRCLNWRHPLCFCEPQSNEVSYLATLGACPHLLL
jgi:hypothetical protein